jgi:hypothetical protein
MKPLLVKYTQMSMNAFDKWFTGSVVVDSNNKPLQVYHGTIKEFSLFKTKPEEFDSWYGLGESMLGASFSESKEVARTYPPSVRPDAENKRRVVVAYLKITRPIRFRSLNGLRQSFLNFVDTNGLSHHLLKAKDNTRRFREYLEDQGYDGITFSEGYSFDTIKGKARVWMVFHTSQITTVENLD